LASLGTYNTLTIVRAVDFGYYLDGGELGEILLPKRYITPTMHINGQVEVFVYLDGEERVVATTENALAQVGHFANLRVASVGKIGAFLDWGVKKELLCPFAEQRIRMEENRFYLVYVYIDPITNRIVASSKLDKFIDLKLPQYTANQAVELLVWTQTDFAYKCIINEAHAGILYKNEVFQPLKPGHKYQGFIKKVREDGKIDLALEKQGHEKLDDLSAALLQKIVQAGGFLPLTDHSSPDDIYDEVEMSKKNFKKAIGILYKQRRIQILEKGIQVIDSKK